MHRALIHFKFNLTTHPPLVSHAAIIINFAIDLKNSNKNYDLNRLRNLAVKLLTRYRQTLIDLSISERDAAAAHYILCATIDDAMLSHPGISGTNWAENGLTAHYHRDVNSGEKFFQVIKNTLSTRKPSKQIVLLLYYCFSLCFEGKLRVSNKRNQEKKYYINHLYRHLIEDYGNNNSSLGINIDNIPPFAKTNNKKIISIMFFVFTIINIFFVLTYFTMLSPTKNDVLAQIAALSRHRSPPYPEIRQTQARTTSVPTKTSLSLELDYLLRAEIQNGSIDIKENESGQAIIRIHTHSFFASASDQLDPASIALVNNITDVIASLTNKITVVGHTDSLPIKSRRFPSNHALSLARAESVKRLIQPAMPGVIIVSEGRGNAEPLASNKTAEGRALNRRIEIYITPQNTGISSLEL